MAKGDVTSEISVAVADDAYLDMQPSAGTEWVIHNINVEDAAELYFYDGTNSIKSDIRAGYGGWHGYVFHCTNTHWYRVKNVCGAAKNIGYDGVVTKQG